MIRRFVLCLAVLLLAAAPVLAQAAPELLEIQASARPQEMVEPGDVTLNFIIENSSGTDAQNVYLSSADGLVSEPVGRIAAGELQSFSRPHAVTPEELAAGEIIYIISHDDPEAADGKINYTVSASIRRSDMLPQVEFTRQLSSRSVAAGESLTISYRMRNSGNVALTNLVVQDALGDYTGRIDRLDVGESRALLSRVNLSEAASSAASLSYNIEGSEETFTETLADVEIPLAQASMDHALQAQYAEFAANTAEVILTLNNTGNVDYRNICVTDALYGGVIADELVLPAGGSAVEIRRSYALRGEDGFQWRVTGTTAAGGKIDFLTQRAALPVRSETGAAQLSISAEVLTPRIRRSGDVPVVVRIANSGGTDVQNLVLSEVARGDLRSFEVLAAGSAIQRELLFPVTDDTAFNFSIAWQENGESKSLTASPVQVLMAPDGVLPEGASRGLLDFTGTSIKIGGSSTFAVLLIIGCALLLALIVLLVIANHRARMEKQLRIAAEKQRKREEMAKTNSFKPVRTAPKKRKKGRDK